MGDVTTEKATESVAHSGSSEKREERSSEEIIDRWICDFPGYPPFLEGYLAIPQAQKIVVTSHFVSSAYIFRNIYDQSYHQRYI